MRAMGLTHRPILTENPDETTETVVLSTGGRSLFVYAEREGWFEPAVDIGERVEAGGIAGYLHDLQRPLEAPEALVRGGGRHRADAAAAHAQPGRRLPGQPGAPRMIAGARQQAGAVRRPSSVMRVASFGAGRRAADAAGLDPRSYSATLLLL